MIATETKHIDEIKFVEDPDMGDDGAMECGPQFSSEP